MLIETHTKLILSLSCSYVDGIVMLHNRKKILQQFILWILGQFLKNQDCENNLKRNQDWLPWWCIVILCPSLEVSRTWNWSFLEAHIVCLTKEGLIVVVPLCRFYCTVNVHSSQEFFLLLLREIQDPKYGMFRYFEESRRLWFSEQV